MSGIVSSLKTMIGRWALSHVLKEIAEVPPSFADQNATPPIPLIGSSVGIEASRIHSSPDAVFDSGQMMAAIAMNEYSHSTSIALEDSWISEIKGELRRISEGQERAARLVAIEEVVFLERLYNR